MISSPPIPTTRKSTRSCASKRESPDSVYTHNKASSSADTTPPGNNDPFKKRHIACEQCRKRKLKCSGTKPSCLSCTKHNRGCEYSGVLKKSGPKPGYIKKLENRLEQLESMLAESETQEATLRRSSKAGPAESTENELNFEKIAIGQNTSSKSLLLLGVDEPYPSRVLVSELMSVYSRKMQPHFCFVEPSRFIIPVTAQKPGVHPYLFYAVMAISACLSEKHKELEQEFYTRCVKYLNRAELKGLGEEILDLQYVQALSILSIYEHLCSAFSRAWITCGKSIRGAQMLDLHRLDGRFKQNDTAKRSETYQVPSQDKTMEEGLSQEEEFHAGIHGGVFEYEYTFSPFRYNRVNEARRTFWTVYILDRYGSVGTGWSTGLNQQSITTKLFMEDPDVAEARSKNHSTQKNSNGTKRYKSQKDSANKKSDSSEDYSNKPLYCSLEEFIRNPDKFERGTNSFIAFVAAYGYILSKTFELLNAPYRSDDRLITGNWWTGHNEILASLKRFAACLPKIDPDLPHANFIIGLHIVHHTCVSSLARASTIRARSLGKHNKTTSYEHMGLQSAIDLTMALRQSNNLYDVLGHPGPLYCLFAAAKNFLVIIKEKVAVVNSFTTPPPSGSYAAANLAYNCTIIIQCRSYLDFLLTVLNIVRSRVFMAQCFYQQLHLDITSANLTFAVPSIFNFAEWVNNELKKQASVEGEKEKSNNSQPSNTNPNNKSFKLPNIETPGSSFWRTVKKLWESREMYIYYPRETSAPPDATHADTSSKDDTNSEPSNLNSFETLSPEAQKSHVTADFPVILEPLRIDDLDMTNVFKEHDTSYMFRMENNKPVMPQASNPFLSIPEPQFFAAGNTNIISPDRVDILRSLSSNSGSPDTSSIIDVHSHSNMANTPFLSPTIQDSPALTSESFTLAPISEKNAFITPDSGSSALSLNEVSSNIKPVSHDQSLHLNLGIEDSFSSFPGMLPRDVETQPDSVLEFSVKPRNNAGMDTNAVPFTENPVDLTAGTNEAMISNEDLEQMAEFDNILKYSQRYPEHLNWNSEALVDNLMKELMGPANIPLNP